MSNPFLDEVAEAALLALREPDPNKAAVMLQHALRSAPERVDLIHALAVTELRRGEARDAYRLTIEGERICQERRDETAAMLMPQLLMARAAACEDLYAPAEAEACFLHILEHEDENPRAEQGLGYLLLGWGRTEEAIARLDTYLGHAQDALEPLEQTQELLGALQKFRRDDIHPRMLLEAHRGGYVEFFDHHAERMGREGWIAEAARMKRAADGRVVPVIPEDARPYAAVRIDLVNPQTGQPGQVGDQPMVVALQGYERLAAAPVTFQWPPRDFPFPVWVSSQCPWDQLPIQIRFARPGVNPLEAADKVMGDWYTAGFDGAFGSADRGRFHYISDPQRAGETTVVYDVDLGRAEASAIPDLLRRLSILHESEPIEALLLGRGYTG